MKWDMTDEERASCAYLMKNMQETEQALKIHRAEVFRMEHQRLVLDRQQNMWLLRFALGHGVDVSFRDLDISVQAGLVQSRD